MPRKHISQLQNSKIANSESWLQAIIKFPQHIPLFFHYSQFHKASLLGLPSHTQTHTTHTLFRVESFLENFHRNGSQSYVELLLQTKLRGNNLFCPY